MNRLISIFLAAGLLTSPARAQFWDALINPDVSVTLTHPPGLGLKVQRVAFAPVTSPAAEDLVAACIDDLASTGKLEVLDRGNIEKVLSEQKFSNSGLVDERTAVELGKLLGSTVLLFVKVNRMEVKHLPRTETTPAWTGRDGQFHPAVTTYFARTQVEFAASVQAADLATGKVYSQKRIARSPRVENSSTLGTPEWPSDTQVRELAIGESRTEVTRMLLPWNERRTLIYYDDKDYGMKEAYRKLKAGDTAGALARSMTALDEAAADRKVKTKYLGRTRYNAGMCHFILGQYELALSFLQAARATDPNQPCGK